MNFAHLSSFFLALRLFFFPAGNSELPEIPRLEPGYTAVYEYNGFTLRFNEETKLADWVAYELTREEATEIRARRTNRFYPDRTIPEETAVDSDYRRSGYDRGHLAPAADMRFSPEAMHDCFCLTNIAPQTPQLNRGIWARLESEIREWAQRDGALLIVTGPVFTKEDFPRIGAGGVAVPPYFFKVLLDYTLPEKKGIAFLFPNTRAFSAPPNLPSALLPAPDATPSPASDAATGSVSGAPAAASVPPASNAQDAPGTGTPDTGVASTGNISPGEQEATTSETPLEAFFAHAVTIDQIEALTGLDFFPWLPDEEEQLLEATTNVFLWQQPAAISE